MFKKKYTIHYYCKGESGMNLNIVSRDVYRVPNIGEEIYLECYGEWGCKVINVITIEKHDPNKNEYEIHLKRI